MLAEVLNQFALDFSGNITGARNWNTYSQTFGNPIVDTNLVNYGFYAQDQWRLNSRLLFNYGVRYDYLQPMHSNYQNLSVFRPELIASNGLAFQGNQISEVYPSDWTNFSPRLGFSFAPASFKGFAPAVSTTPVRSR